jgi:hypothetical protein
MNLEGIVSKRQDRASIRHYRRLDTAARHYTYRNIANFKRVW